MKEGNQSSMPLGSGGNEGTGKFFNTIHLNGKELKKAILQAGSQERKIMKLLNDFPNIEFTKHEIKKLLVSMGKINEKTPESSISRALTNLMNDGKVIKLDKMRLGEFDKPNHLWRLNNGASSNQTQTEIF